jgi:hypothetical protein
MNKEIEKLKNSNSQAFSVTGVYGHPLTTQAGSGTKAR